MDGSQWPQPYRSLYAAAVPNSAQWYLSSLSAQQQQQQLQQLNLNVTPAVAAHVASVVAADALIDAVFAAESAQITAAAAVQKAKIAGSFNDSVARVLGKHGVEAAFFGQ